MLSGGLRTKGITKRWEIWLNIPKIWSIYGSLIKNEEININLLTKQNIKLLIKFTGVY